MEYIDVYRVFIIFIYLHTRLEGRIIQGTPSEITPTKNVVKQNVCAACPIGEIEAMIYMKYPVDICCFMLV